MGITTAERPSEEAVRAALARLNARLEGARPLPAMREIHWEWPSTARRCYWCRRSKVQLLYKVRTRPSFRYERDGPQGGERVLSAECLDSEDCAVYRARQDELRTRRSGTIFTIVERPYQGKITYRGQCGWCGEEILLRNKGDYRRSAREYHRGDEYEVGDRNCRSEWWLSRTSEARVAVARRDLLKHGRVFCAECGLVCVELVEGAHSRLGRDARERPDSAWEADHRIALEDGGTHTLENLQCLCVPCHRTKTARENRERAERRAKVRDHEPGEAQEPRREPERPDTPAVLDPF